MHVVLPRVAGEKLNSGIQSMEISGIERMLLLESTYGFQSRVISALKAGSVLAVDHDGGGLFHVAVAKVEALVLSVADLLDLGKSARLF